MAYSLRISPSATSARSSLLSDAATNLRRACAQQQTCLTWSVAIQPLVLGQGIRLQIAPVVTEEAFRPSRRVIRREVEHHIRDSRRRRCTPTGAPWPCGPIPATRNFTEVSSPWITRDSNSRRCISWYNGSSRSAASAIQSPSVDAGDGHAGTGQLPGQAMQRGVVGELGGDAWASSPGPHNPLGIGPTCAGPAVCSRCSAGTAAGSQCRQA